MQRPVHNGMAGDVLYVPGIAASILRSPRGTSSFKSSVPSADAHIRDAMLRVNCDTSQTQLRSPTADLRTPPRQAAGRQFSSGNSELHTTSSPRVARALSPSVSSAKRLCSASFRSKTPTACAHINALPRPVDPLPVESSPGREGSSKRASASFLSSTTKADAHIRSLTHLEDSARRRSDYVPRSDFDIAKSPVSSASFKSATPSAVAHIKALNKPSESTAPAPSDFDEIARHKDQLSASYRSTTSFGDAHIRALPKPVDVCTAFTDA